MMNYLFLLIILAIILLEDLLIVKLIKTLLEVSRKDLRVKKKKKILLY